MDGAPLLSDGSGSDSGSDSGSGVGSEDSRTESERSLIQEARSLLEDAERIVVLTGAGVSAESGVPTFRGPGGMWKSFRAEDLATPEAFNRDPLLVWEWYSWRRQVLAECEPNAAHLALADLALSVPARTTIVTQNVDGLHHRAARVAAEGGVGRDAVRGAATGVAAARGSVDASAGYPLEVHGAIHRDRCNRCGVRVDHPDPVDSTSLESLPRCDACGGPMRPDVVWFGEMLDPDVIGASYEAAREADVCLVVGTSALVYPAASIPDVTAGDGGSIVEINLEPTALSERARVSLMGRAGDLVPRVLGS